MSFAMLPIAWRDVAFQYVGWCRRSRYSARLAFTSDFARGTAGIRGGCKTVRNAWRLVESLVKRAHFQ
jgi:hypothetical protein